MILLIAFLIGVSTGIISGLFGIGGGIVFVPMLYILLPVIDIPQEMVPHIAIGTSLFVATFSAGSASVNHLKSKNVKIKEGILIALGTIITSYFLPRIIVNIDGSFLKYIVAVILIAVIINLNIERKESKKKINLPKVFYPLIGLIVGVITSFSGLGGGVIFVPVLIYILGFDIKKAIGTSSMMVTLNVLLTSTNYALLDSNLNVPLQLGYVNLYLGIPLAIGALIGSYSGVKIFNRIESSLIKRLFSIFLALVIIILVVR